MKVTYLTCCGVDVHKSFLVATIIKTGERGQPSYKKQRFSTFNSDIRRLKRWLLDNDCHDVCMESAGKYWIPVSNLLEDEINVVIANPKWVKAVKGNKDDTKDSKRIGDLFRLGLVPGSFIPSKDIRMMREYTRYRSKLVSCKSGEKNRFQNSLTVCNVALDSVVSDMFGKSATDITNYILQSSDEEFSAETCREFLRGKLKQKADLVVESVDGCQMTQVQKDRALLVKSHMEFLDKKIALVDEELDAMVAPHETAISLMCTIPGVNRPSAITILSEIGPDMSQFSSSKRLCCWAGLTPSNNESAGKKKSVKISRAGVYLKPALVQCAHAAVKSTKSPYYKDKYERISKRRGKKRAIIAIARMILTAIYQMLSTGEVWNPCDLYKVDMPQNLQDRQRAKAVKSALKLLISEGIVSKDTKLPDIA